MPAAVDIFFFMLSQPAQANIRHVLTDMGLTEVKFKLDTNGVQLI